MRHFMVLLALSAPGCGAAIETQVPNDGPAGQSPGQGQPLNALDLDRDGDGLTASEERALGTSDLYADTDGDGLSDYDEVSNLQSDPLSSDTDSDGLADGDEVYWGTSLVLEDTDEDGVSDYVEVDSLGSNPLMADSDGDGLTDSLEMHYGTSPVSTDSDWDGISDWDEVSAGTNPLNGNDPPPFVRGDTFSFLTQPETDVVLNMLDGVYQTAMTMRTECSRDAERGRCACDDARFTYVVQRFEAGLSGLLDQMGVPLTITQFGEVSAFMHNEFDRRDDCGVKDCVSVSLICAY